jgi:hypothetical protein
MRRVPGREDSRISQPFKVDDKGSADLCIEGSATWIHMIGPIGVYYIHKTDIHPTYKQAFSYLLWWMYKLRRRYIVKSMMQPTERGGEYTLFDMGREWLAKLEILMPSFFCTFVVHLLQHACSTLLYTGPVHGTWMFVFERWIQIAKGLLHSPKGAEEGLARGMMRYEWRVRNSYRTKDDLKSLITPPPSHIPEPIISLIGNGMIVKLDNDIGNRRAANNLSQTTHRLIFRFLCSNDPLTSLLQQGLRKFLPQQAHSGEITLDEWDPSPEAIGWLIAEVEKLTQLKPTEQEIKKMLKGPSTTCLEYIRMEINGTTFCTLEHEGVDGTSTRCMIFYKMGKKGGEEVLGTAHIERIYTITSNSVLRFGKVYNLIKVRNYVNAGEHESELLHVKPASMRENIDAMPIIRPEDIHPFNIAAWPAGKTEASFLIVFTECTDIIY